MNNIQVFNNEELGCIRTVMINDQPWFVGKDIAVALGYSNPQKAIRDHIDVEDKLTERIVLSGQNREVIFINESGLYSLILSSKLPSAKKFKRWVTQTQDRGVNESFTVNGTMATIINESGLYSLILSSKLTHHVSIIKRMSRFTTPI